MDPHNVEFVKAEIRTGLFFSMIGADHTFQNPQHCESPTIRAQQIYQAMRRCLLLQGWPSCNDGGLLQTFYSVHLSTLVQSAAKNAEAWAVGGARR
jgi:hypothetical protein